MVALHASSAPAHVALACFDHFVAKRVEQARVRYEKALALDPSQPVALSNLAALLHFNFHQLPEAEQVSGRVSPRVASALAVMHLTACGERWRSRL